MAAQPQQDRQGAHRAFNLTRLRHPAALPLAGSGQWRGYAPHWAAAVFNLQAGKPLAHLRIRPALGAGYPPPRPITVNTFDPSLMPGTGLARDYAPPVRWIWETVLPRIPALTKMMFGAVPNAAPVSGANLARLAVDPAWKGITGKYVQGTQAIPSSPASYDERIARELWESSKGLVKLTPAELALA